MVRTDYHVIPEMYKGERAFVITHGENKLFRFMNEARALAFCTHHNLADSLNIFPTPCMHDYFDMATDTIWSEPHPAQMPIPCYPEPKKCKRFIPV